MNPYYGKYISNHKVTNHTELIVLPLCDNSHFYDYIADLCKGNIIFIDSLYKPKSGPRSIVANLTKTFFSSHDDIKTLCFYEKKVQHDGHSCGAWLISGVVAYILGFYKNDLISLNREKIFNVMITLSEDMEVVAKQTKSKMILRGNKTFKRDHHSYENSERSSKESNVLKRRYAMINDSSEDEKDDIYEAFVQSVKKFSTPEKNVVEFIVNNHVIDE